MQTVKKGGAGAKARPVGRPGFAILRAGMPVEADGTLNPQEALGWISRTSTGAAADGRRASLRDREDRRRRRRLICRETLLAARTKKLLADAGRAERLDRQQAGELVSAAQMRSETFNVYRQTRDACLAIPARCSGAIVAAIRGAFEAAGAAESAAEAIAKLNHTEVHRLLAAEVRKVLEDLASAVGAEPEGLVRIPKSRTPAASTDLPRRPGYAPIPTRR